MYALELVEMHAQCVGENCLDDVTVAHRDIHAARPKGHVPPSNRRNGTMLHREHRLTLVAGELHRAWL